MAGSKYVTFLNGTAPMSMKVSNTMLHLSYDIPENKPIKIALFNPEGRLVKETVHPGSTKGKQSTSIDISFLASGFYIVKLQAAGDGAELFHSKFIYSR